MVQSWENFMDPSGGYRRNEYVDGTAAMTIPLITEGVLLPMVYPRAEAIELKKSGRMAMHRIKQNQASFAKLQPKMTRTPSGALLPQSYSQPFHTNQAGAQRKQALIQEHRRNTAKIKGKYAGLKSTARAVGWGYLALMGVEMGAAIFAPSPGVSTSAMENDARAMGYNAPLDSSQAYTQRQRALMAIHDSQLGIRNVIGAEAPHLHR